MHYTDEISYNTLFQVNATILVGLLILISLLPIVLKDPADIQLFEQSELGNQDIINQAQIVQNITSQNIQQLMLLLNTENLTDAQRSLLTDIISKENRTLQYNNQLIDLSTQSILLEAEQKELASSVNASYNLHIAYSITSVMMFPFGFSIYSILIHQYRAAKYLTIIGLVSLVIVVVSLGFYIGQNALDLSKQLLEKTRNDLEILKRSGDTAKNMSALLDNLSSQYNKLESAK